jgi:hypothetical protein
MYRHFPKELYRRLTTIVKEEMPKRERRRTKGRPTAEMMRHKRAKKKEEENTRHRKEGIAGRGAEVLNLASSGS